jgi:hypothetical protein
MKMKQPSVYPLPKQRLFAVEYPGYVKNIHKVTETLGEKRGLLKVTKQHMNEHGELLEFLMIPLSNNRIRKNSELRFEYNFRIKRPT